MSRQRSSSRARGPSGSITIREVAREAGVSTATVSRALNEPDKVRPDTRERVLAVVRARHFVFHGLAAGLASRRSRTLGLVIPTIKNSIYAASTQAIQHAAQASGYSVLVGISEFSPKRESELVLRLLERRVDGLILTGEARPRWLYDTLAANRVPLVVTWKLARRRALAAVSFDNYKASVDAVEHLIGLGHRRIGLVCGRSRVNDRAAERRRAYEDTLIRHGLPPRPDLVFERDFDYAEGREAVRTMLESQEPPTAVFCANDVQAVGALAECRAQGIEVPRHMSVVGFDDLPIAEYALPQLTTIGVPADDMGHRAAESLIRAIENGTKPLGAELPTELVLRASTAPPPARG